VETEAGVKAAQTTTAAPKDLPTALLILEAAVVVVETIQWDLVHRVQVTLVQEVLV